MPLRALAQNRHLDEQFNPFEEAAFARAYAFERLEPEVTPKHPDWSATVYYDLTKFGTEASLERIARHYAEALPGREYHLEPLSAAELKRFAIVKYSRAEELFRRRGFVSDVEVTAFKVGERQAQTAYSVRNQAAVNFQLAAIEHCLQPRKATKKSERRRTANLQRLIGQNEGAPVPLVERDDVFLPCVKFWNPEQIHLAHASRLPSALRQGRQDPLDLCHAMPEELRAQIQFERRNSRALFNDAGAFALLLWQTQALAVLRKASWQIGFFSGPYLNAHQKTEEKQRQRALRRLRDNVDLTDAGLMTDALKAALGNHVDVYQAAVMEMIADHPTENVYGVAFGQAIYTHGLSTEQNTVAAFHGSTYQPDVDPEDRADLMDPINWLHPVAEWIGDLKRHRHGVLSERIIGLLLAIFGEDDEEEPFDPQLSRFASIIQDRLGDVVWTAIAATILGMRQSGSSEPIPVVYEWTRDAQEPWAAERRADGTLVIRGPLLDFPVSQATSWNEKSRILREEGGLVFRRRRDANGSLLPAGRREGSR